MSDVSRHEVEHAADHPVTHTHVPADPNDGVVRAGPPRGRATLVAAVAALCTAVALIAVAIAVA